MKSYKALRNLKQPTNKAIKNLNVDSFTKRNITSLDSLDRNYARDASLGYDTEILYLERGLRLR
jgi:hypothetical protein